MRKRSGRPPRFAQVPNDTVDDSGNLDLTALGLLTAFLRHRDGWDITLADVGQKYGHGEDALAHAMGALQLARYVVKVRVQGAGNKWRTEMAVYAPPATPEEVEQLLADIREEDPAVRKAQVIEPTATAVKRAEKRRAKLAALTVKPSRRAGRTPETPGVDEQTETPAPGIPGAGEAGLPDSGFSRVPEKPRVSKNTVFKHEEDKTNNAVADAVGQSAGGFARAGACDAAADESGEAGGGSAASEPNSLPIQRTTSPRPATVKTKPRQEAPGFADVRAALPAAVAAPGTKLFPGLTRAINDLLTGAPGIPRRTPEQVIARVNRRWFGENAEDRAATDYRGCDRCTASGCDAPRRGLENPEGCDRIKNRNGWLAAAIIAQDCPDPGCEDGEIIGGESCRHCQERRQEARAAAQAAKEAAARWEAHQQSHDASQLAVAARAAWQEAEAAEEARLRERLGYAGVWGTKLDYQVGQHMTGWRDRTPRPAASTAGQAAGR